MLEIRAYLREQFPEKEAETIYRLERIFKGLVDFPSMGKEGRIKNCREYAIPKLPYITVYRLIKNDLQILRIYHGSRNPYMPV